MTTRRIFSQYHATQQNTEGYSDETLARYNTALDAYLDEHVSANADSHDVQQAVDAFEAKTLIEDYE